MRTTVTIDPDVELLLKRAMRDRDTSFKQILNDGLRQALSPSAGRPPPLFRQPVFSLGKPRVDLTKATALSAELEDIELATRLREGR